MTSLRAYSLKLTLQDKILRESRKERKKREKKEMEMGKEAQVRSTVPRIGCFPGSLVVWTFNMIRVSQFHRLFMVLAWFRSQV